MSEHIRSELADGVLTVTLDRADKKNAITQAMYSALAEATERARTDDAVRVLLLRADGDTQVQLDKLAAVAEKIADRYQQLEGLLQQPKQAQQLAKVAEARKSYREAQKRVVYRPVSIEPREITPRVIRENGYGGLG